MNKNQEKENVAKVVDAIQNYATAYKALNTLQIAGDEKDFPIPKRDQKTGCIGEFYSYLYLASILEQGQQIDFGGHSEKFWDLKVVDRDKTIEEEKGNFDERTIYHWIQVKTVSAYAKFRTLSPIHLEEEPIEKRGSFGTRFSLYVLHLNERSSPDGFWIFEKDTLHQIARNRGLNTKEKFSLKGIHCPDPQTPGSGSQNFEWDKYDKTGGLLKVLSRY